MDEQIERVLAEYQNRFEREEVLKLDLSYEELLKQRDDFLLPVGPAAGQLLNLLVRELRPKLVVELGTAYGYSTVWLAEAARAAGSRLISMEIVPEKVEYARSKLAEVGLQEQVEFMVGDAQELIRTIDEPVDFVLLDLWKEFYTPCFELLRPRLEPGALIVADNMLQPKHFLEDAARYRQVVAATGEFETIMLPIGNGLALSRRL